MCYIRKELMRPYLSISDVIIGDFWTTWKRRYLHAYGRVYLGRVTLFADDGSLELQWKAMAVWPNSCIILSVVNFDGFCE